MGLSPPQEDEYGAHQPREPKFRLDYSLLNEVAAEPPWRPEAIPESDKRGPVASRPLRELTGDAEPFIFTRGHCDVAPLAALLRNDDDVWSDAFAARHNVPLERPSHDAWGIRKLCFVFCDDFLLRAYRLPLFSKEDSAWLAALRPALDTAGVHPSRLVRCLLASMPPKTVIPAHHDSGYWVSKTHRLHCAIVTDPKHVVFRVGRTTETMRRFDLREGAVVELNNQAKHYVANLSDSLHRVHLIFDYADGAFPDLLPPRLPVVTLNVGDRVAQTRRSIALASERGSGPKCPHFLIIGAQKAGTTSMFEYLCAHPLVARGARRETHFLDWRWPLTDDFKARRRDYIAAAAAKSASSSSKKAHSVEAKTTSATSEQGPAGPGVSRFSIADDGATLTAKLAEAWHRGYFDADLHDAHPSLLAGDSTPSYLLASHLAIPRLKRLKPGGLPLVVMLRDPVERAKSHHAMILDPDCPPAKRKVRGDAWLGRSLRDVARDELRHLVDVGLLKRRRNHHNTETRRRTTQDTDGGGRDDDISFREPFDIDAARLPAALRALPNSHGSHSLLLRGLYALQLDPWLRAFDRDRFIFVRCEDMATPDGARAEVRRVQAHLGLRDHALADTDAHNTRPNKPRGDDAFEADLRAFYHPFNLALYDVLGWTNNTDRHWAYPE